MGHIFISYSHKDTGFSHKLGDILRENGFDVWIDARLDYGSTWPQEIQKQLDTCSAFIIVMSPRSYASEWVQNELNRAKRLGKPIYPFLLEGDGPWLSVESTQFVDVTGGKYPDEKFYSTLERIVPRSKVGGLIHSDVQATPVKTTFATTRKTSMSIFAGTGVLILILIGMALFTRNRHPAGTPTLESESKITTLPEAVSTEPIELVILTDTVSPTDEPLAVEIKDNNGVFMLLVPAGKYVVGTDNSYSDAGPAHSVLLDAYYIDRYEVTNASYAECVDTGACVAPKEMGSSTHAEYYGNPEFNNYPVVHVDWYMAGNYCSWRGASLPTEAQWEVAARGVNGFIYPWGNNFECRNGNFDDEIGVDEFVVPGGPNCDRYEDTSPVGSFLSGKSPFGLFDMAGNVWEWVFDSYLENYYATLGDGFSNPQGPVGEQYQVVRGGSWGSNDQVIQAIYRGKYKPADYYDYLGFRCAMDATP